MTRPHRSRADRWPGRDLGDCRILFVTHAADRTGAPLLLLWFLRWLREHHDLDAEVLVLRDGPLVAAFDELYPTRVIALLEEPEARPFDEVTTSHRREQRRAEERARALRSEAAGLVDFDVLYVNSALSGACFELLPEIPPLVLTSVHDMGVSFSRFVAPASRQAILDRTDWYVTCADVVTATLVGAFGVRSDRIVRHHGFIEPVATDPDGAARLRTQLGVPPDAPLVGAAGTVQWRKGPDLFVQVAAAVQRRRPDLDAHFVWAGGADPHGEQVPIEHDIAKLGLADRCHLLGSYDAAAPVLSAFDVFCLSSREDPFPLVMLEAAALGAPIVGFATGGVTELATASGDPAAPLARIVEPLDVEAMASEVIALLDDPTARDALAARARAHVEAHHVAAVAAPRLYDDLRRIIGTPERRWPESGRRRRG